MKFHTSRTMMHLLILTVSCLVIVLIFAFAFLIPNGKAYRIARMEEKKVSYHVDAIQAEYDKVYEKLKGMQADNRHIIGAYKNIFDAERFTKMYASYFENLSLFKLSAHSQDGDFAVYEVNASSLIQSPQGFYDFLDAINKSDNIIGVNFPIHFQREGNLIQSSFTMHVYAANQKKKADTQE